MNDHGSVLTESGQKETTKGLQKQALSGQRKVLGPGHKRILWASNLVDEPSKESRNGNGIRPSSSAWGTTLPYAYGDRYLLMNSTQELGFSKFRSCELRSRQIGARALN
jgi:hypothetical protein